LTPKTASKNARSVRRGGRRQIAKISRAAAVGELDQHAAQIRLLHQRCLKDAIEIGERLSKCRVLLKDERRWLSWLKTEFAWSRRTADRLIGLAKNQKKVRNVAHLPVTALCELAVAPPKTIELVEQRAAIGPPPTAREVLSIVREAKPLPYKPAP
jgi:hypothetical protein